MSRRESREAAFKFLYQLEFRRDDASIQKAMFLDINLIPEQDMPYFDEITDGVVKQKEALDSTYSPLLIGWKIDRIPKIDLILLRIACYEILFMPTIPTSVSISEAVILAKRYSTEESKSYINAILGKLTPGEKE